MSGPAELDATRDRAGEGVASSVGSLNPGGVCVTCLVRVGRPRATVLRAVVCGPCWAAHGGFPDASEEVGPAPVVTVASWDPRDQRHWLSALRRQDWVGDIRVDGRANLLRVARLVALHAGWETLESRPTWARLVARSGLSERTVARWLQELRVRGWLAHLEHGSTPAHRPMVLAHLEGNRAAVYGLRIPLSPQEALHRATDHLMTQLANDLTNHAVGEATEAVPDHVPTSSPPEPGQPTPGPPPPDPAPPTPHSAPPNPPDQPQPGPPGDTNGTPSWSFALQKFSEVGGFSRASKTVDNLWTNPADPGKNKDQRTALRAGWDQGSGPDWAVTVPTSPFAMLIAADWLRRRLPVFASCSRKLTRHLCKPYWSAGWCNRDILHAMDHRPSLFHQTTGVLICPQHITAPQTFIRSRLNAWRTPHGTILPGHWTSHLTNAATLKAARQAVATRHGRAGAALLRPGEHTLTTHHITEHAHNTRPPANPTTRTTAKNTLTTTLTHRARTRTRHP
jgi:hypothetical protein